MSPYHLSLSCLLIHKTQRQTNHRNYILNWSKLFFILKIQDHEVLDTKPPSENLLNQYDQEVLNMMFIHWKFLHSVKQSRKWSKQCEISPSTSHYQKRELYTEPRRRWDRENQTFEFAEKIDCLSRKLMIVSSMELPSAIEEIRFSVLNIKHEQEGPKSKTCKIEEFKI